jgi:hypothetical protein
MKSPDVIHGDLLVKINKIIDTAEYSFNKKSEAIIDLPGIENIPNAVIDKLVQQGEKAGWKSVRLERHIKGDKKIIQIVLTPKI